MTKIEAPKDGVYFDIPFDEYQSWAAINQSSIRAGRKSMRAMREAMTTSGSVTVTDALGLGKAIHYAILEPDLFQTVITFEGNRSAKVGFAKFEEEQGRECLTAKEVEAAKPIAAEFMTDREGSWLVNGSAHEVSLTWTTEAYGKAKLRIDGLGDSMFFDLKTSYDISLPAMNNAFFGARGLQYIIQWGWALEGLSVLNGGTCSLEGWLIAAQTKGVPDAYAALVDRDAIEWGREKAVGIAKAYKAAEVAGVFYGAAGGDIPTIFLPEYLKESWEPGGK